MYRHDYWYDHGSWLMPGFMMLVTVALIGLLVWLVLQASHHPSPTSTPSYPAPTDAAMDRLRARLADGAITADEYRAVRDVLQADQSEELPPLG